MRVFSLFVLLIPFADFLQDRFGVSSWLIWTLYLAVFGILILLLYIRYQSCRIEINAKSLRYKVGFFIRRTVCVNFREICAIRRVTTPLMKHFDLYSIALYCEGVTFLLPPVEDRTAQLIDNHISREGSPQ